MSGAGGATTPGGDAAGGGGIAISGTERLFASDKVEGTPLHNRWGERIGSVCTVMIAKYSGQVAYAVLGFGGFLGVGERYHPLPRKALDHGPKLGGYVVAEVSRERLERAPSRAGGEAPWADPGHRRGVYGHYANDAPRMGV